MFHSSNIRPTVGKKYSVFFRSSAVKLVSIILLFTGLFLSTSCGKSGTDGVHPLFIKAQTSFEKGDYINALNLYKRYLKINPDSVKANYQLAVIYQEQEEYIQAIYYYEKYLALEPNSSDKIIIEKWISSSKEQLFKELEKKYTNTGEKLSEEKKSTNYNNDHKKNLEKELSRLKMKNEKMRDFILRHKDTISSEDVQKTAKRDDPLRGTHKNNKEQIYTVKSGDTLYEISKIFYGTPKYYKFLLETNKKRLNFSTKLMPGDKLVIPPKPGNQ